MRLGKDLENKPIISVTDGRMLGRAKDVYVDAQLQQLAGLYIGTEGMIRRRVQVIQSEDVVLFGIDVILVKDTDVITNDKDFPDVGNWQRLKDLQGYEVHTPGGTKLGTVGDVILDGTGAITGLSLSRVFVKGPLAEQGTVPREVVVETAHKEKTIRVDLAMLEGLAAGVDEKTPAEETPEEAPVEEIDIEVVENNDESDAINIADLDESDEPDTKLPAADELEADSEEQE
jgi:sporulation protein YlmC with PRC-barrel domain